MLTQAQQKYESNVLPAKRGDIYDRNGNILATSQKVYNVILDCKTVNSDEDYVEPTVRALVDVLGLDEKDIRSKLSAEDTKNSQYQIIKKQISMDEKKAFELIHACAMQGHLPAIYDLGANFYYNGVGTEKNLRLSEYYLKMAVDAGLQRAKVKFEQYKDTYESEIEK